MDSNQTVTYDTTSLVLPLNSSTPRRGVQHRAVMFNTTPCTPTPGETHKYLP